MGTLYDLSPFARTDMTYHISHNQYSTTVIGKDLSCFSRKMTIRIGYYSTWGQHFQQNSCKNRKVWNSDFCVLEKKTCLYVHKKNRKNNYQCVCLSIGNNLAAKSMIYQTVRTTTCTCIFTFSMFKV